MRPSRRIACVALLYVGCATTSATRQSPVPSSPFVETDSALFEDGVDMVGYPAGLSGRWADDWARELQNRVRRSDVIALLSVTTLRTDVSPENRSTQWLVAEVGDVLKGEYEGELGLASSEDDRGYASVERERVGLMRKPLIVFAKWVNDDTGAVRPRWHLARATDDIIEGVHAQLTRDREAPKTVKTVEYIHDAQR